MARVIIRSTERDKKEAIDQGEKKQSRVDNPVLRGLGRIAYQAAEFIPTVGGIGELASIFQPEQIRRMPDLPGLSPQIKQSLEQPAFGLANLIPKREQVKEFASQYLPEDIVYGRPDDTIINLLANLTPGIAASLATGGLGGLARFGLGTGIGEALGIAGSKAAEFAGAEPETQQRFRIAGQIAGHPLAGALEGAVFGRRPIPQAAQKTKERLSALEEGIQEAPIKQQSALSKAQQARQSQIEKADTARKVLYEQLENEAQKVRRPISVTKKNQFINELDRIAENTTGLSADAKSRVTSLVKDIKLKAQGDLFPQDLIDIRRNLSSEIQFDPFKKGATGDTLLKKINAQIDKQITNAAQDNPELINAYRQANKAHQEYLELKGKEGKALLKQQTDAIKAESRRDISEMKKQLSEVKQLNKELNVPISKKFTDTGAGLFQYMLLNKIFGSKAALAVKAGQMGLNKINLFKKIHQSYPDIIPAYINDIRKGAMLGLKQSPLALNRIASQIERDYKQRENQDGSQIPARVIIKKKS